jgi:hypothetical protein
MAIVDQLIAVLEYQTKGEADLKRFTKSLDTLATKAAAVGAAMGKVAAVAGAAVAGGLAFLGKSVIDTGRTFENLQIQLEALEGSQDKAKKAMDWIKTFAADTPLELEEVVKAYAQLRTYGLDPVNGSLLALVDTMAMSGKGQEHLDGIITAVGQAWTKQKLQGEEAMQLLERGVRSGICSRQPWAKLFRSCRNWPPKESSDARRSSFSSMPWASAPLGLPPRWLSHSMVSCRRFLTCGPNSSRALRTRASIAR